MRLTRIASLALAGAAALQVGCQTGAAHRSEPSNDPPVAAAAPTPAATEVVASTATTNPVEDEIRRLADRELDALPAATAVHGRGFTASVTGGRFTSEEDDDGTLYEMDLGTSEPVACVVYAEPRDGGATLRTLVQSVGGKGATARVIPGDVIVDAERPVQRLDVLYTTKVEGPGAPTAGVLKLAWIGDFLHPALCYQDELGYSRTFTDIARRLASTLVTLDAERPQQVEILRARFGDVPVGFDYTAVWNDRTDATRRRRTTYSLSSVPMGPGLEVRDTVSTVTLDDRERIRGGRWTVSTNGVLTQNVTVERDGNGFRVSGSAQGKPVRARLAGFPDGLPDVRIDADLRSRIASATAFNAVRHVYSPLEAPNALLAEQVVHGAVPGQVELAHGSATTRVALDENGQFERTEARRGDATMTTEVIYARDGETVATHVLRN